MTWFKVDDGFHSHAKTITAGTAAMGLWVRCGSWSANHLRNGLVPVNVAREFGSSAQIKALVTAGFWSEVEGGYQFNDWEDYNPTADDVKADRAAAAERQRKAREAAKAKRESQRTSDEVTGMSRRDNPVSHAAVTSPRPDPTRPEGSKEPLKERKRSTATPPPDKLEITEPMRQWAADNAPDVRIVVETARMLDWGRGKGEKKADWVAAWRNWISRKQDDLDKERAARPTAKAGNGVYADAEEAWMR